MALREIADGLVNKEFVAQEAAIHEEPLFTAFDDDQMDSLRG